MAGINQGNYKSNLKKAYDFENKAFKQWDKSNFLNAAEEFKKSARYFEIAYSLSENLDQKVLTSSNKYVELSNQFWVLGLKEYSDEENYQKASDLFKNSILTKKKALDLDKKDVDLRKQTGAKTEVKRQEWRIFQQSTLRELYAYYFLSLGLLAEQKKKYKIALKHFEDAAVNYSQQIKYLQSVKKSYLLVRQFLLKTTLRIGECKRILGKVKDSMNIYQSIIDQINSMDRRHKNKHLAILALAEGELAEAYKDINQLEDAERYYWKFLEWAKKIKLEKDQAKEVARVICIITIINIQLNKEKEIDKAVKEFKRGSIFGRNLKEASNNPWYKLASLIAEFSLTGDNSIFNEAKIVYNKIIDNKDRLVTNFFKQKE